MKVLILADIPGWIVDRITDRMIAEMPEVEFRKGFYACMTTEQILEQAEGCDLIHYQNWDLGPHRRLLDGPVPILVSVRSHRYPEWFPDLMAGRHVHVISKALQEQFPGSHYIPDGVLIEPERLIVGFAGKPGTYKGSHLIEQACREIGAQYLPAVSVNPCDMRAFYRGIDVLVCASEDEGFGAPVMEALALNKPVISTRCGAAWEYQIPGVTWVDRTLEAIKAGLEKHWTSRQVAPFSWRAVCGDFLGLYKRLAKA